MLRCLLCLTDLCSHQNSCVAIKKSLLGLIHFPTLDEDGAERERTGTEQGDRRGLTRLIASRIARALLSAYPNNFDILSFVPFIHDEDAAVNTCYDLGGSYDDWRIVCLLVPCPSAPALLRPRRVLGNE
jgi:hypothetical protein